MQNVAIKLAGDKMVITVNLKAKAVESKSGKTMVIASTRGNESVPYGDQVLSLGLNLYRKK